MMRRRADWASCVIESASSRMMILNGGLGYVLPSLATPLMLRGVSLANALIFSRTTLIPRSSEALSSSTRFRKLSGLRDMWWPSTSTRQSGRVEAIAADVAAPKPQTDPNSCFERARIVDVLPVPGGP
jgi:hypothetical protein